VRVLHVNKFLYRRGGAEAYMLDLAALQRARGDDVSFFAMQHPDNLPDPHGDTFPPRMELNPPPRGVTGRVATAAGILYRPSSRSGIERIVDRVRPDVVHLHNIYHQLSPSVLRPLARRGIPTVMTLHDYKLVCPTYQLLDRGGVCEACLPRHFHQAVAHRCNRGSVTGSVLAATELTLHTALGLYGAVDVFLCPSEFMRRTMARGRVYPERLAHVPHFAELGALTPAAAPGSGVLFVGRLAPEKGVDVLLEAVGRLGPHVGLVVAGDGPERASLQARARELGLATRVRFVGRVPAPVVNRLMRAAAVVAVPSRWHENQPMTILEAFGAARPVVTTDLGGLPELVDEGETGSLVRADDPGALADALHRLTSDPRRAHRMGLDARRRAAARFSVEAHLAALDAAYARAGERKAALR
jgi:glycosyltransferase involved in cell wall biosynthesis